MNDKCAPKSVPNNYTKRIKKGNNRMLSQILNDMEHESSVTFNTKILLYLYFFKHTLQYRTVKEKKNILIYYSIALYIDVCLLNAFIHKMTPQLC